MKEKIISFLKKYDEIPRILLKVLAFVLLIYLTFSFIIGVTVMSSEDMQPNVKLRDVVVYSRIDKDYAVRTAVVYEVNGNTLVGRVVALPGSHVTIDENGNVTVDNILIQENDIYLPTAQEGYSTDITLGADEYFILADNRQVGVDSRYIGPVHSGDIKGESLIVIRRYGI